ncbi:hypothetical protein GWI33_003835 [Rhynchophorus ferrugineus]|uniref:Uncharacterized protein n=1 Tax=Rhynchophorus ferrugineus TaxID=354439 RepID=A0A834HN17_RHYFE|nr:hypothetical protein GWI33_003844 [Rhynchophorus ferrugineus]KAF7262926.1 hypothetical protein GWI33_003835 [Rhynchophorus ferrugineus]
MNRIARQVVLYPHAIQGRPSSFSGAGPTMPSSPRRRNSQASSGKLLKRGSEYGSGRRKMSVKLRKYSCERFYGELNRNCSRTIFGNGTGRCLVQDNV